MDALTWPSRSFLGHLVTTDRVRSASVAASGCVGDRVLEDTALRKKHAAESCVAIVRKNATANVGRKCCPRQKLLCANVVGYAIASSHGNNLLLMRRELHTRARSADPATFEFSTDPWCHAKSAQQEAHRLDAAMRHRLPGIAPTTETERDAIKLTMFDGVRSHFQTWRWAFLRYLMAKHPELLPVVEGDLVVPAVLTLAAAIAARRALVTAPPPTTSPCLRPWRMMLISSGCVLWAVSVLCLPCGCARGGVRPGDLPPGDYNLPCVSSRDHAPSDTKLGCL